MDISWLIAFFGIYLGSFVVGFVGGLIPITITEIFLVGMSIFAPKEFLIPIILLSVLGQMAAKSIFYFAGRGIVKIAIKKDDKSFDKTLKKFKKWENKTGPLIFMAGVIGIPPLYVTSILCGSFKINYFKFLVWGGTGRLIRFALVVLFPQLIKTIFF
jgi:membrane protein YqaA with SNARE-associated domain